MYLDQYKISNTLNLDNHPCFHNPNTFPNFQNELKTFLVEYVGEKNNPDSGEVTVEMIVDTMARDFPEFVLTVAEENWIRGYQQAMIDVEVGERLIEQETKNNEIDE